MATLYKEYEIELETAEVGRIILCDRCRDGYLSVEDKELEIIEESTKACDICGAN